MARIDWVVTEWENWARWYVAKADTALGYPKQSSFARLHRTSEVWSREVQIPVNDVRASRVDDVVRSWQFEPKCQRLHLVVTCTYVGDPFAPSKERRPMSRIQVALRVGVETSTVSATLERADAALAAALTEKKALAGVLRHRQQGV